MNSYINEKSEIEKNLKLEIKSKTVEFDNLQQKINDLSKTMADLALKAEKTNNLEKNLKEKEEESLQLKLQIQECESLFQKRLEILSQNIDEQNKENIFNINEEKQKFLKVNHIIY